MVLEQLDIQVKQYKTKQTSILTSGHNQKLPKNASQT